MNEKLNEESAGNGSARLSVIEARVLACLIEKEATTPDVYPLSLNSLVNACNQKSNRSPVMALGEDEAETAVTLLRDKHLVTVFAGAGARSVKYRHKFGEVYPMEKVAQAMMTELMLRGAQTVAGLRGNCERITAMPDAVETEAVLTELASRTEPLVVKLPRQPGQKEPRWAQLLTGNASEYLSGSDQLANGPAAERAGPLKVAMEMVLPAAAEARITTLEAQVTELRAELARLRGALAE